MPTPLGYLTENSLTPYPFKDGSSLRPTGSGTAPLANDVFLDFQLTTTDNSILRVALTQLYTYTNGYGSNIRFTFTVFRLNTTTATWTSVKIVFARNVSQILAYGLVTEASGQYRVKLVPGAGMVRLLGGPYGQTLNFAADPVTGVFAAEFNSSTVIPIQPHVSTITFKNVRETSPVLTRSASGNTTIQAGANVVFEPHVSDVGLNVRKGAGIGLYDPCADLPTGVIKSINGINSDDFVFATGDCYRTVPLPDEHTVKFEHTCRPKCTNTEVNAFAYYANRVQDGLNRMGDYVKGIVDALKAQIAANEAIKASQVVSPYIDAQIAKTLFNNRAYESIGIGIYDPNKKKLSVNLDAYFSGGIADSDYFEAHPTWTDWVLYPGSPVLREDNNTYPLSPVIPVTLDRVPLLSSRGIDCRGSTLVNFVASIPSTASDQWVKLVLTAYEGATLVGTAFKYLNVLPTPKPYFNVRSRRGIRYGSLNTYVHTVTIELFDSNPSWSGLTSFSAVINSTHTMKTPQLRINSGAITSLATSGKTVTFSNRTIDYPNRAVVTFQLESATTAAVNMTITMTVGAQQTTLSNLTFS